MTARRRRVAELTALALAVDAAGVTCFVLGVQHGSILLLVAGIVGIFAAVFAGFVLVEVTA